MKDSPYRRYKHQSCGSRHQAPGMMPSGFCCDVSIEADRDWNQHDTQIMNKKVIAHQGTCGYGYQKRVTAARVHSVGKRCK